ncbi:MAG: hypothetical protein ACJA0M_000816 [Chitinophagales bacterium]|jgi:hypothetical protein
MIGILLGSCGVLKSSPSKLLKPTERRRTTVPLKTNFIAAILCVLFASNVVQSEDKYKIEDLWPLHIKAMNTQKTKVDDLLKLHIGSNLRADLTDIKNMQRLLDSHLVNKKDPEIMQAMGMALGDVMVSELKMHWVIYEDKLGRSKALQYRETQHFLFPVTMLSRRAAGNAPIDIQVIYDKAAKKIEPYINSGPFMYYDEE